MAKKAVHAAFVRALDKARTEEDVKNVVAKQFDIAYDTADRNDLYTPQVLFEFKFDKNFASLRQRAAVLAQALYYMRRLKFGYTGRPIPGHLCLADRNEGLLFEAAALRDVYADEARAYDWDLAPSSPDPRLTAALLLLPALRTGHFRIGTWDAGWFQVRNALADQNLALDLLAAVKRHHAALGQWLLPQLATLGFLP